MESSITKYVLCSASIMLCFNLLFRAQWWMEVRLRRMETDSKDYIDGKGSFCSIWCCRLPSKTVFSLISVLSQNRHAEGADCCIRS